MTRDFNKAPGGRENQRGGIASARDTTSRLTSRAGMLCFALCCVLVVQPPLILTAGVRAEVRSSHTAPASPVESAGSLTGFVAQSLLSIVTTLADGVRPPAAALGRGPSPSRNYAAEPVALQSGAPTGLSLVSTSDSQVVLSWDATSGAALYRVERSAGVLSPFAFVGQTASNGFADAGVSRGNTYLYRVRAVDSSGAQTAASGVLMATAISFADAEIIGAGDPQGRPATSVKAQHVLDLRAAVSGVRRAAGKAEASWSEMVSAGVTVRAAHVQELRDRLDEGLAALGLPIPSYTDPTLQTGAGGTPIKKLHFEQLRERSTRGGGVTGSAAAYDFAAARLDPSNRTGTGGVDILSGNFNWGHALVGLPGRSGLDLGLSLSYNSLVWTKSDSSVLFDGDWGSPSPGFRLGFPVVQGRFYDPQALAYYYMLVTPSGARVALRQTAAAGVYEAADSSYLQLSENADWSLSLRATDGTRMTFRAEGGVYKCAEIKDSNGNFITAAYNVRGDVETITDTLGRVLTFEYDEFNQPKFIKQTWRREVETGGGVQTVTETHEWAEFFYDPTTVRTNFAGLTVFGPKNGQTFRALTKVKLADKTSYRFNYTTWGQVNQVARYAESGRLLNYVTLGLPVDEALPQVDCPRASERRDWAAYWNGDEDGLPVASEEAVTGYEVTSGVTWANPETQAQETGKLAAQTSPDGTVYKEYSHASGWGAGLVRLSEVWSGGERKKWTSLAWTQDDEALSYPKNPRVRETNVYDSGSRRRVEVVYTSWGLPQDVKEYDADAVTVLRRTHTDYLPASVDPNGAYAGRRIIGLPSGLTVYGREDGQEKLFSKLTYEYDLTGEGTTQFLTNAGTVARHDGAAYGAGFTVRGNLSRVRRWDVTDPQNQSKSVVTETGYNTLGSAVFARDALGHKTSISYADSDGGARLAYPTLITDPGNFSSSVEYNYDIGAVARTVNPKGAAFKSFYDSAGRRLKAKNEVNGAYTKWEYGANGLFGKEITIVDVGKPETFTMSVVDGAGRLRGTLRELHGSIGSYSAQRFAYDHMGRHVREYNPAEVSANTADLSDVSSWQPAGDDSPPNGGAGWVYSELEYDWKGRVTREVNADGATDRLSEYAGCGCAGGQIVTVKGELVPIPGTNSQGRRRQKVYSDVLGRPFKTEVLDWNGSVYSATTTRYDALDRAVRIRQYAGAAPSQEPEGEGQGYQTTTMTFDGHGRLQSQRLPRYDAGKSAAYQYYDDDTVRKITDARGVSANFSYNVRKLLQDVTYDLPPSSPVPVEQSPPVTFSYDEAGNRLSMVDGVGRIDYEYDTLSRLRVETRTFNAFPSRPYPVTYDYNLAGALKSIKDPFDATIYYGHDKTGAVTDVTGTPFGGTTRYAYNMKYRAWGALKHLDYENGKALDVGFDRKLEIMRYTIPGLMDTTVEREGDGRIGSTGENVAGGFARAYRYDHAGRLVEGLSGSEALGLPTADGPYRNSYQFDEFDHLKGRTTRFWTQPAESYIMPFQGDRAQDGYTLYDAAGNVTQTETQLFTFDAAGQTTRVQDAGAGDMRHYHDGDGRVGKRVENRYVNVGGTQAVQATTLYFVRSSVLGGRVLTELTHDGQKDQTHVYAGQQQVATQRQATSTYAHTEVVFEHRNPVTGSLRRVAASGAERDSAEFDPSGANVGATDPFAQSVNPTFSDISGVEPLFTNGGNPLNKKSGCAVDGMPILCDIAAEWAKYGALSDGELGAANTYEAMMRIDKRRSDVVLTTETPLYVDRFLFNGKYYPEKKRGAIDRKGWRLGLQTASGRFLNQRPQGPVERRLTDTELAAMRAEIEKMIANDKCRDFIDKLVSFNRGESFSSKDKLLDWLDGTAKAPEGGIFFKPGSGGSGRNRFGDYAKLTIGSEPFPPNMLPSALQAHYRSSATTLLHELIHSLTYGSDDRLSREIRDLGIVPIGRDGKSMDFPDEGSNIYAYSAYWGTALKNACFPD